MNSEQTEKRAVLHLDYFLQGSSSIQTDFNTNDKTPMIDGFIRLYDIEENQNRKKNKFLDHIVVQIKGTTKQDFCNKRKYQIDMADLMGLKKMGGGIFFVVYLCEGSEKIFFRNLLPYELDSLDNRIKSKVFDFYPLDKDLSVVQAEFQNFILHRDKQQKNVLGMISIDIDQSKISTSVVAASEKHAYDIVNRGITLYQNTAEGIAVPIGVTKKNSQTLVEKYMVNTANGFETSYSIVTKPEADEKIIIIGDFITINFIDNTFEGKVNFENYNSFIEILEVLRTFEDIIIKGFYFNGNLIEIGKYFTDKTGLDRVLKMKQDYEGINNLFDRLEIDKNINFTELSIKVHQ